MTCADQNPEGLGRIEEYRTLRHEIVQRQVELQKGLVKDLTLMAVIAGYGVVSQLPPVFLLGCIVTIHLWRANRSQRATVRRMGKYIADRIEPHIPHMNWETTNRDHHASGCEKQSLSEMLLRLTHPYASFLAFDTLLAVHYSKDSLAIPSALVLLIYFVIVAGYVVLTIAYAEKLLHDVPATGVTRY